jgi:hypothetical protein
MRSVGSGKGKIARMRSCAGLDASPMIVDLSADRRLMAAWVCAYTCVSH